LDEEKYSSLLQVDAGDVAATEQTRCPSSVNIRNRQPLIVSENSPVAMTAGAILGWMSQKVCAPKTDTKNRSQ